MRTCNSQNVLQLDFLKQIRRAKPPKIHQFDLFYDYKEMEQLGSCREKSRLDFPRESLNVTRKQKFLETTVQRPRLPSLGIMLQSRRVFSVPESDCRILGERRDLKSDSASKLPTLRPGKDAVQCGNLKAFSSSKKQRPGPKFSYRSLVRHRIVEPVSFNPFADVHDPQKVYRKAAYLAKLPVNPKVDLSAIERRLEILLSRSGKS